MNAYDMIRSSASDTSAADTGGDDAIEETSVDGGDVDSTADDTDDSADVDDGTDEDPGSEDDEQVAEDDQSDEDVEPAAPAPTTANEADIQKRITELAKRHGLDPNDPKIRAALRETAILEKKSDDRGRKVDELESTIDWMTPWEKEQAAAKRRDPFAKPAAKAEAAGADPNAAPAKSRPIRPGVFDPTTNRFNDGFDPGDKDGWTSADDCYKAYQKEWAAQLEREEKGVPADYSRLHALDVARLRRQALPAIMPMVADLVQDHLTEFENSRLGDIAPVFRQQVRDKRINESYAFVRKQFETAPQLAPLFKELVTPGEGAIEMNGQSFPNSPFYQYLRDNPDELEALLDAENSDLPGGAAEEHLRRTALAVYRRAMKQAHERRRQAKEAPKKIKQVIKSAAIQAERDAERQAVRAATKPSSATPGTKPAGRSVANQNGPGLGIAALMKR